MAKSVEIRRATQEVSAIILGVAQSTLRSWKDAPRNQDGTYDLPVLNAWYFARKAGEFEDGGGEKSEALEEYRRWRARQAKLDYEKACGELIPVVDVRMATARHAETCKRSLLALAPKLAPLLVGRAVEEIAQEIDAGVRDCLDELSEGLKVSEQGEVKEAV